MQSGGTRRAVGPRLRVVLILLLAGFVLLALNSLYLAGVTLTEQWTGASVQGLFYQYMFLFHLAVGLALVAPIAVFLFVHARAVWHRQNRAAVRMGQALMVAVIVLILSGLLLIRFDAFAINDATLRRIAYWSHVLTPIASIWLFVLHRLAGPPLRWRGGVRIAAFGAAAVVAAIGIDFMRDNAAEPAAVLADFSPALVQTAGGGHIDAQLLMKDRYCQDCHADVHERWAGSVHSTSSFNNPVYRFSVINTRNAVTARDGHAGAARFCAGCHDPVPLLSGRFDEPGFDLESGPEASASITCTACHAITAVNSPRGNADYTIEAPVHYPFAFSDNASLRWINAQLIKAKPAFHKKTFLKPVHQTTEFCGTCHKVHLPPELNDYKWLRGQNHYDAFLLSGVSGHGVTSFYYPKRAQPNCNGCHMAPMPSTDFGAKAYPGVDALAVRDHLFPGANTGIAHLLGQPDSVIEAHRAMLEDSVRVDLVGLRRDGQVDGDLIAPLRPQVPALEPGSEYLLELVLRTLTLGHMLTQGTSDSNELWVEIEVLHEGRTIARSGGLDPRDGAVDPWSHFVNSYVLDRDGHRIALRNVEDAFVALYDHQIPPGAADALHYRLRVPDDIEGSLTVRASLHYRKFDTTLLAAVEGDAFDGNDLPIVTLGQDEVVFPVGANASPLQTAAPETPEWLRLNDYGIGALRKPERRQLRQAEALFTRVENLGESMGALNLARVYLEEGRLDDAAAALGRAERHDQPPVPWSLAWFSGRLLFEQGRFPAAIEAFEALYETRFAEARERGFDFSRDYRLTNQIGLTWGELALQQPDPEDRERALGEARRWFETSLARDPENAQAHYQLARIARALGDTDASEFHASEHRRYRVDDNARDRAVANARRRDPAADHAANAVVIYDLHRDGADRYEAVRADSVLKTAAR
ncbi:MAG: tetratricopeptide repeat protein [Pseudomonadota bacterium]